MISISVWVDRAAALLRGHALGERVTIEVSPEAIGPELWPHLVGGLNLNQDPPVLNQRWRVAEPTAEAVRAVLAAGVEADRQRTVETVERIRRQFEAYQAAIQAPPTRRTLTVPSDHPDVECRGWRYEGWYRQLPYVFDYLSPNATPAERAEYHSYDTQATALKRQSDAEIEALNAAELEAALPRLRAEHAAMIQQQNEAEAAREKVLAERAAARLASGYWERETSAYNERRYGPPWCALVTGVKTRGELVYQFGDSTAKFGSAGLLRLPCKPGDIIAWGQKDHRKPSGSENHILRMQDDGRMQVIDRTEAYRILSAR